MTSRNTIVIAGGSGALGQACARDLRDRGYEIIVLSRSKRAERPDYIHWDPDRDFIEADVLSGARAILNFCGTPLDGHRWTKKYKKILYDSRVVPSRFLGKLLVTASPAPELYLGASGIGIYGDSGPNPVTEEFASTGNSFTLELARAWEASHPKGSFRTVLLRIAPVFMADSGFVQQFRLPGSLGFFPHFGNGNQYLSWIHYQDLARAVTWMVEHEQLDGVFNAAANAAPLRDIVAMMRKVRGGFGIQAGIPRFMADIALGEMAQLLWESCNASSDKLRSTGFDFDYIEVENALSDLLNP